MGHTMRLNEMKLPVQKRSKARLELVIESTIQILEQQGIAQCTIPEIARVANLPKINIYQYFPTVNHLLSLLVQRYLDELQNSVLFNNEQYREWQTQDIVRDLIKKVADFYNQHQAASILILGGPVHVEGFNLQEMVIEHIAEDLKELFANKQQPLMFKQPAHYVYLVEITFSLMKHSFYKFGSVTENIVQECIELSDLYIQAKTTQHHKIK